jgi:hypothetical protein
MICPTCQQPARRLSGGYEHIGGKSRIAYWVCDNDDCDTLKFSAIGQIVKILTDEPGQTFKNSREALRVLRLSMRDDREWFGEVSEETLLLARQVVASLTINGQ